MTNKKPNVFPSKETPEDTIVSNTELSAAEEMLKRTEEQMRLRGEALKKQGEEQPEAATVEAMSYEQLAKVGSPAIAQQPAAPTPVGNVEVIEMMTPKWDASYDMIPLPSKGKMYKGVKPNVKVAYMTGSDENILTSANLLESGDFLKVLISRNLLEPNLKYEDLLLGDRNAIMIWLRGSSFGNMYSMTIINNDGAGEEVEYDLNDLKYIYMEADPDENGLFDFTCPQSKDLIKYRYLTVRDEEAVEAQIVKDTEAKLQVNHRSEYTLQRQIISVNGNSDSEYLSNYIDNMRLGDIRAFRKHYDNNESGVDLKINVRTSGGGSLVRFFPLTSTFFGLTHEYRNWLEEEFFVCVKHIGYSYVDLLKMPTFSRRYQIHLLMNENRAKQDYYESKSKRNSSMSNGKRTTTVTGDALKAKMRSGEIQG